MSDMFEFEYILYFMHFKFILYIGISILFIYLFIWILCFIIKLFSM